jgi:hypothetical protein
VAIFHLPAAPLALRMYRELTGSAPDELMAHTVLADLPDFGPAMVVVYSGADLAEGQRLLAPLRRFALVPTIYYDQWAIARSAIIKLKVNFFGPSLSVTTIPMGRRAASGGYASRRDRGRLRRSRSLARKEVTLICGGWHLFTWPWGQRRGARQPGRTPCSIRAAPRKVWSSTV